MVGVVVTGHGGFAAGMAANVKMLAGSDAELKAVDFADGMDVEVFEKQLAEAIDSYADCEAVLVLADIAGGTPYNRAAGLSMTRPKVRVISGLNSSMLMDLCMRNITGDECPDVDALAADIMQTGHENIGKLCWRFPPSRRRTRTVSEGRNAMKPIKAVIFDMDGVLIDSEPVYLHHQYTHLKPSYPWITLESMYPLVGISGQEYMPFMAKLCRRTDDAAFRQEMDAMNAGCRVYYPDILRKEVRPLLHELKQMGLQVALASSSSRECIEQVLTQCKIRELFDCIVSGHEFTHSKPDPEIYRFTMDKLKRRPEECLIVEDSTYGVQAGTAAGGVVAALRDERFPFDQRAAQLHIDSLAELPALAACGGKRIRAAFFDVDGTLITVGGHRMPPSVAPALQALQRSGVQVFLCTGRHALEIEEENMLPGITVDGAVYMNGQLCELQGQIVRETPIPARDLSALKQFLQKKNCSCIFLEKDRMYANCVDSRMEVEQAKIGTAVPAVRDISDLENRRIYQVIPFVNEEEEEELLRQMPHCRTKRWGDAVVDLMSRTGGKENGIRALCAAIGITTEETIAFGDADNDLEMLQLAGIGVAMGNALPQVRACADMVTDTVENDGIAHALRRLKLIE